MMRRQFRDRTDEGFTLIELLIVIVILAILAAIVVFAVGTTTTNAKVSACNSDAKSVETAVEAYKAQMGTYPTPSGTGGMGALLVPGPNGPWLRQAPSATLPVNGYAVTLIAGGVVQVQNNTNAAANYDTTNNCNTIT
jgi:prepilin-type N-terminal cleavage/methylation domain-containing protein